MTHMCYPHFTLVHQLKRRVRVIAPSLRKDTERTHILAILLNKRKGIERVRIIAGIASITIYFDPLQLPVGNLLTLLDSVIHNLGNTPATRINTLQYKNRRPNQKLNDYVLGIGGMRCASCALYLEMLLQRQADVVKVSVNYLSETARVKTWLPQQTLFALIEEHGYQAYAIDSLSQRKWLLELEQQNLQAAGHNLKLLSLLSVPVALLGLIGLRMRSLLLLQALLATPVVWFGGRDIFNKAWALARQGTVNMDSLITLGVGSAYVYSLPALFRPGRHVYFDAATAIIDFVMLGRYLEALAKSKMISDIRKLVDLQPQRATLLRDEKEVMINADQIVVGDILLIRPGEKIPVDGIVIKGLSSVNEAMITGVSSPVIKEREQQVFDGSLNGGGSLQVRATAAGTDTLLAGLIHMVDQTQASKLQLQKSVDRVTALFVPAVIALSAATFVGWLIKGEKAAHALAHAIAVLLISCPCALGLATPAATTVGSSRAARRGIYIRNGEALESAARIDTVIFDKTGTLTEGNALVSDFFNISSFDDAQLIQLAASVEYCSEHLLGQAIVRHAREQQIELHDASNFFSLPDLGVRAKVDGHAVLLGSQSWLEQQAIATGLLQATANKLSAQGKTLVFMAVDQHPAGLMALTDPVRLHAEQAILTLHAQQIETLLVTGDSEAVAQIIAHRAGIDRLVASANPEEKLRIVRELQQQGQLVAMVGDGINDAPALAAANLSLAIDKGTDIAIQASDLILRNGDISRVADAIILSRETLSNIRQNLFWAFAYNAVAIPLAVAGKLTPTVASLAMAFSSVSVIVNSLRWNKS